jgi:hypothetical protein
LIDIYKQIYGASQKQYPHPEITYIGNDGIQNYLLATFQHLEYNRREKEKEENNYNKHMAQGARMKGINCLPINIIVEKTVNGKECRYKYNQRRKFAHLAPLYCFDLVLYLKAEKESTTRYMIMFVSKGPCRLTFRWRQIKYVKHVS